MSRADAQCNLRVPAELLQRLRDASQNCGRSLTAEIVHRLNFSFATEPATMSTAEPSPLRGMPTLRDQFAMAALTGILASPQAGDFSISSAASWAYAHADAMLAARAKEPANG